MSDYTREQLIGICERAIVPESDWRNRDSAGAQRKVGKAWALLRAGCKFWAAAPESDYKTIWIEIEYRGYNAFEYGPDEVDCELFYLPTEARLAAVAGKDWY